MGRSLLASHALPYLAVGLALSALACRPDRGEGSKGKNQGVETPAQDVLPVVPEVHPSTRAASEVALVLDDSRQLCADLVAWKERDVHLVCDPGQADPQGKVLRAGLTQLRKQLGRPLSDLGVLILATVDRGGDVRALMAQEPSFFARAAVWTEGRRELVDQFGPTFLERVSKGGAQRLLLLGVSEKEYAPWLRLARRGGLQMEAMPRAGDVSARAVIRHLQGRESGLGEPERVVP